jgi:phage gp16-like protein
MSSLAKIHIGKKQLGLAEDDYRDLLERTTGKRSSASMSEGQRQSVL